MLVKEFDNKIIRTKLPYDSNRKLYLEYDNFNTAQQNEETFVPLLNFPVQRTFSYAEKRSCMIHMQM